MINLKITSINEVKINLKEKGTYNSDIELALLDLVVYGASEPYISKLEKLTGETYCYE